MKIISHRGYLNGENDLQENNPTYINECLNLGYDVEIDIRLDSQSLFLGHDKKKFKVELDWIFERKKYLWIHCKNMGALEYFRQINDDFNFFWHENDIYTLTSQKYIWAYPCNRIFKSAVNVLPELNFKADDFRGKDVFAVCTDFPDSYSYLK